MELLSVRDLCKKYPGFTLDHVSFSLESGYIMGFIGRNGAGKTTTLKSMLGLVHPDGGAVQMFGMDLRENESARRGAGRCALLRLKAPARCGGDDGAVL